MLTLFDPPSWAADRAPTDPFGPQNVDLTALGDFAHAAATRYSGRFGDVPRVPYWVVWNEANLGRYLNPQFVNGKPEGGVVYRALVNTTARAIHAVRADDLVIAGATAPFTAWTKNTKVRWGMGPLQFMRTMLCLSPKLKPTCSARTEFDVWSHHPYTSGGPTHHAFRAEDVSLGDLPEMKAVLDAAIRYHRIVSRRRPQFWVTEFAWDTNPPDHGGVPSSLAARWTAEALYRMWSSGVTLATWYAMRDGPYPSYPFQGGLYFRGKKTALDRPKPSWEAFRFPFVAYKRAHGVFVWGRTPTSRAGRVRIDQQAGSSWRLARILAANRYGVFTGTVPRSGSGPLRAQFGGETSNAFSLSRPKDRFFYPFGDWHP
jgi:hypothetical protein